MGRQLDDLARRPVEDVLIVPVDAVEYVGFVRVGVVAERLFVFGGEFDQPLGDVVDGGLGAPRVEPEVGVLPATLADALLVAVETRREFHEFDALADVDELSVHVVVFQRLDGAVGPRLEVLPDVDERVGLDDVARDARVRFPAVAVEPRRDEVLERDWRVGRDLAREVVEAEERGDHDRAVFGLGPAGGVVRVGVRAVASASRAATAAETARETGRQQTGTGRDDRPPREFGVGRICVRVHHYVK
ncbi:hypothetical protein D320_07699 [Haloferax sp. BAB-2207]|nr:hypothetical protein D320_07699 [Haloferax sp. BAB-2207]